MRAKAWSTTRHRYDYFHIIFFNRKLHEGFSQSLRRFLLFFSHRLNWFPQIFILLRGVARHKAKQSHPLIDNFYLYNISTALDVTTVYWTLNTENWELNTTSLQYYQNHLLLLMFLLVLVLQSILRVRV